MIDKKRIYLNTIYLYISKVLIILSTLYSVRIVLDALGAEDYGIYNLVAGIVAMFAFLNSAMTASTQRFLSYSVGADDSHKVASIFKTSIALHILLAVFIVVILEVLGIFLFDNRLNISPDRVPVAKFVYQCVIISTFFVIVAVPYNAMINANEDLHVNAIIDTLHAVLRLGVAFLLLSYKHEKLILYGVLIAILMILTKLSVWIYSTIKYQECRLRVYKNEKAYNIKEVFAFAGWNTFGALCDVGKSQGIAVVLNLFFGAVINAAYAIAIQISTQLSSFAMNILQAFKPQIVKSEGAGNRENMLYLSMLTSKYCFLLMSLFAIPLLFEMPYVLSLWLKDIPEHTVIFSRFVLLSAVINLFTIGLQVAVQAIGKIKMYQMVVGSLLLLNVPIIYILLKLNVSVDIVILTFSVVEFTACIFRLLFIRKLAQLSIRRYFKVVIVRVLIPFSASSLMAYMMLCSMEESFLRLVLLTILCTLVLLITIYFWGIDQSERSVVNNALHLKNKTK